MFSFLLGINLGVELLGHMVTLCVTIWGTVRLSSKVAAPFYIPPAVCEGSSFSTSSPTLVFMSFLLWPSQWARSGISLWFGFALPCQLMILSIFGEVQFICFSFAIYALCCLLLFLYLRSHCIIQNHKDFMPMFSPKSFIVLALTQVFDPFWVNFCMWCEVGVQFISFHMDSSCPSTICRKDYSFLIRWPLSKTSWP